jgi:uncharacterized CHY-type Zn-finger protein
MHVIHGVEVFGDVVDENTRCTHYQSDLDIIAIKFKCCRRWFPCRECHDESESHATTVWSKDDFETAAILCGACGQQLVINRYLACDSICPACDAQFNPRCSDHYQSYFEMQP